MEAQPARYVPVPVVCSKCNEKQVVHTRVRTSPAQIGPQEVECLKCHTVFLVMVPNDIIGGPFPSGS
jgi:hypothetical protein